MEKIGKYEIEFKVGSGGMGDVFCAFDPTVRRRVAIKVLNVDSDSLLLQRFNQEATAAGNLNHPNIVTIYEYGEHDGRPYLVMEYLEGRDLQSAISAGQHFEIEEVGRIMSQVADGLDCAHRHGVIHRDVKPANVMLLPRAGVKLVDFGIARLSGQSTQQRRPGQVTGTVLYMSPEHFENAELDVGVDIWAYGVIYYQLLTGRHPFEAPDQRATVYKIVNADAPPIRSLNKDVPEALAQIVHKCLAKGRDQRYPNMEELRLDSSPVLQDLTKRKAARMVADARTLLSKGQLEDAQELARRSLELDPGERTAHDLRKAIAEEMHRQKIRSQAASLCARADEQTASRQFAKAIDTLEEALRLDPESASVQQRISAVRSLLERERRAAHLFEKAQREFSANDLQRALFSASELVQVEPGHEEGARLLAAIKEEIAKRERQRRWEAGLTGGRNMLRIESYDEAVNALRELVAEFPVSTEAIQLLREAEAARDERDKRRRLQQERTEAMNRLKNHAANLQNAGQFEEALGLLKRGQAQFPGEPDLVRLAESVMAAKLDAERRAALETNLQRVRSLQGTGDLAGALAAAGRALQEFGPNAQMQGLRDQLLAEADHARAADQAAREISQAIGAHDYAQALKLSKAAVKRFPGDERFAELPAEIERQRQDAAIEELIAKAYAAIGRREFDLAEKLIASARKLDPNRVGLDAVARDLEKERPAMGGAPPVIWPRERSPITTVVIGVAGVMALVALYLVFNSREKAPDPIALFPQSVDLTFVEGGKAPDPVRVRATGQLDASFTVKTGANWIDATPTSGRLPSTIRVTLNPAGLSPGQHEDFIDLTVGGMNTRLPVRLTIMARAPEPAPSKVAEPDIKLNPEELSFEWQTGGELPRSSAISIAGVGAVEKFEASSHERWITVRPADGTVPGQISVRVYPIGLRPGPHTGHVLINVPGDKPLQKLITVNLMITGEL
jgi:serine/threonine protein kinase